MTRRTLISGAPALLLHRALKAQRPTVREPIEVRYHIPNNPLARWNFCRLGQSLTEGMTIASVPDDSGNGNNLGIFTGQSAQAPMFTEVAMNGRGAYWAGGCQPNPSTSQSPPCAPTGALQSPNMALSETPLSILFCAEFGSNGQPNTANPGGLFQVGNIQAWSRGGNSSWPKGILFYNFTSTHGITNYSAVQLFCGPVSGAFVTGYGGTNSQLALMSNRTRVSVASNWNAGSGGGSWNLPMYIGYAGTANSPCACLWHEIVVYNRALSAGELDIWQVYCNQMYGTPLARSTDTYVNRRVIFMGDSNTDGQNATRSQCMPNVVAKLLGNWNHVEYLNYGVGSATIASHITNFASYTAQRDASLGKNIAVFAGGYYNDETSGLTYAQAYANLTTLVGNLQSAGFTVAVGTMFPGGTETGAQVAWRQGINGLILANSAAADAVINTTPTGSDPGWEAWCTANLNGHLSDAGYARWAAMVAPVVNILL